MACPVLVSTRLIPKGTAIGLLGHAIGHDCGPVIGHSVVDHNSFVQRQAEQARPRIPSRRMGRYRPHLDESKAHGRKRLDHPAIFVEPRGHAQRIGKVQAAHFG